jgi:N-methylhydantoinase A
LKKKAMADGRRDDIHPSRLKFRPQLDVRYQGQSYELTVDFSSRFRTLFEKLHKKQFGYTHSGRPLEIVNLRLQARVPSSLASPRPRNQKTKLKTGSSKPEGVTQVFFGGKFLKAPLYRREKMEPSTSLRGPAVIAEYSATTFVPPGWYLICDPFRNLVLEKQK